MKNKIIKRLELKAESSSCDNIRMPSIKDIHKLLDELGIKHTFRESVNIVEYRSKGARYVNSRHSGKEGYILEVGDLKMDTSDSYYSFNSWNYSRELLRIIDKHQKNK